MHVLHLHGQHLDTGLVAVQDLLEQHRGVALDLQLAVGDGRVDEAVADDLAHGGLGGVTHQVGGVADVEQVLDRVADFVLHAELDVDDVLVTGEHGGFLGTLRSSPWRKVVACPVERKPTSQRSTWVTWGL